MTTIEIETALRALGYHVTVDGHLDDADERSVQEFQLARKLIADGDPGPKTQAELTKAVAAKDKRSIPAAPAVPARADDAAVALPLSWMPACTMTGIVVHWTAGAHKASWLDRAHYHVIIEDDGKLVRGDNAITNNAAPIRGTYAAHTLRHNTGIIGVSLACMAGAIPEPFDSGVCPMTRTQWDALPPVLAALCRRYGIPVGPKTVLSHAEVSSTLGIPQRGKWDIARLSFDLSVVGAHVVGDLFRARTAALLAR